MSKTTLSLALWVLLLTFSFPVGAQQPKKVFRVGYLSLGLGIQPNEEAFRQHLRELGYVTGRTSSLSGDLPKAKPTFFLSLRPNWSF